MICIWTVGSVIVFLLLYGFLLSGYGIWILGSIELSAELDMLKIVKEYGD